MTRKEKLYNFIKDNSKTPFTLNEIILMLNIKEEDFKELKDILSELLRDKKIVLTKNKRYRYNKQSDIFEGMYIGNEKGFGFIQSNEFDMDFFVSRDNTNNALNGDIVKFQIIKENSENKRAEAKIIGIEKRTLNSIVGTFEKHKNFGFVRALDKKMNKDIFISSKHWKTAKNGNLVVCTIIDFGNESRKPEGVITEILGDFLINGNDVRAIIKKYDLPTSFSDKLISEAKKVSVLTNEDFEGRIDLRDKLVITIDGADAKDLDDAISLTSIEDGAYILGVHIADVSHYVEEGSVIDKEAYKRGTSVYLADRVIPMLPKELSNGICSLHPGVDRLTLSVFMTIDKKGNIINCDFKETVINSKYRMTYDEVTNILENNIKCDKKLGDLLNNMKKLSEILRAKRKARGSLDFDFPECKIIYDKDNNPVDIKRYTLTISNYIIEEFMLAANETVAEYIYWQNKPLVFRIHEEPENEKIEKFKIFIKNMGYSLKGGQNSIRSKTLLELLDKIKGDKNEKIIQTIMLRSLMKARYSIDNKGHFGLASEFYCHFTSPIRRYPDLMVHRILKSIIKNSEKNIECDEYIAYLSDASLHTSERERIAESAERDTVDIKKAIYMMNNLYEEYDGIISSVTKFGIFVELDNTVEGLIRYENLRDDYYIFDELNYTAEGEKYHNKFTIGDKIRVMVSSVNPQLAEVNFEFLEKIK